MLERDPEITTNHVEEVRDKKTEKKRRYGMDKKKVALATALSIGAHVGVAGYAAKGETIQKELSQQVAKVRRQAKNLTAEAHELFNNGDLGFKRENQPLPQEGKFYVNEQLGIKDLQFTTGKDGQLEIAEWQTSKVNWPHYFFHKEQLRGVLSAEEAETKEKIFQQEIEQFKQLKDHRPEGVDFYEWDKRVLHEILSSEGDYDPEQPYLAGMVPLKSGEKKQGDCKARLKRNLSIVSQVFPDMPLKIQISNDPHERLISNLGSDDSPSWYVLEGTPHSLSEQEIEGTVMISPMNFLSADLNTKREGNFVAPQNAADQSYDTGGVHDGFNLLPPGVRATNNVFKGRTTPSVYTPEQKLSFESAQERYRPQDMEVRYVDVEDLKPAPEIKDQKDAVEIVHLLPREIVDIKMKGGLAYTNQVVVSDPGSLHAGKERIEWSRFHAVNTTHQEKREMIARKVLDLTPLKNTPLKSLVVTGYKVDVGQLKNKSELMEVVIGSSIAENLDTLADAKKLEKFSWDGIYYDAQDDKEVSEEIFLALRGKKLTTLTLSNFPLSDISFTQGMNLKDVEFYNLSLTEASLIPLQSQSLEHLDLGQMSIRDLSMFKSRIDSGELEINERGGISGGQNIYFDTNTYRLEINPDTLGVPMSLDAMKADIKRRELKAFVTNFDYDKQHEN
jgi:hypothetical protein